MHISDLMVLANDAIFVNGIWPSSAPDSPTAPYATFLSFETTRNFLGGKGLQQNRQVQIDIWSATTGEANALADQVETAMAAHSLNSSPSMFDATQIARRDMPQDPDTRLCRVELEFSIWYRP